MKRRLLLVAGHNRAGLYKKWHWRDPGVVYRDVLGKEIDNEHWLMERTVIEAYDILKQEYDNIDLMPFNYDLKGKIEHINKFYTKRDIVISFHANGPIDIGATGSEVFYVNEERAARSEIFAKKLADILANTMCTRNRGAKDESHSHPGRLGIISRTVTMDFVVELEFDREKIVQYGVQACLDLTRYLLERRT